VAPAPNTFKTTTEPPTSLSPAAQHVAAELRGLGDDEIYACVVPVQDLYLRARALEHFSVLAGELRAAGLAGDAGARHLRDGTVLLWLAPAVHQEDED
jgi:hypothetical protein